MGSFMLAKMTLSSLFSKPSTIQYPKEQPDYPEGLKGHIVLDAKNCILCGICMKNCTTNCIEVNRKERKWSIDPFQCVQCGYCITVCPKKCLLMDQHAPGISTHISQCSVHVDLPERKKPEKNSTTSSTTKKNESASPQNSDKTQSSSTAKVSPSVQLSSLDHHVEELIKLMEPQRAQQVRDSLK